MLESATQWIFDEPALHQGALIMFSRLATLTAIAATVFALSACQTTSPYETAKNDGWSHFGEQPTVSGQTVALGAIGGDEQDVIIEGTVKEMCTTAGCWLVLTDDGGNEVFVTTDHKFFLPRNATNHHVVAHGHAKMMEVSVEQLRHLAKDAGKSPEEIAEITEPEMQVKFVADSIFIEGRDLEKPYEPAAAAEACEEAHEGEDHGHDHE
jgi:hypothetical protein